MNVLLIDENGNNVGLISKYDAIKKAKDVGLDLVDVSPNSTPPVCKIMDLGKFKYKKNNKNKKTVLKEVQFNISISRHDLEIKAKKIKKFLDKKYKVKLLVKFKGREIKHDYIGFQIINDVTDIIGKDTFKFENEPTIQGKNINAILINI